MRILKYSPPQYSISDYNKWDDKWELIDGLPHYLSSSVMRHQLLGTYLLAEINIQLRKQCGQWHFDAIHNLDWRVDDYNVVRPDISVNYEFETDYIMSPPVLIVEILSTSSYTKDTQIKFQMYQEHGVKYYVIADPDTYTCIVYVLNNGRYVQTNDTLFTLCEGCDITLDLSLILDELRNS